MKHDTDSEPGYVFVNNKMLRKGHTTGSCAAAASKAAAYMLLTGRDIENVRIKTPSGIRLNLGVEDTRREGNTVSCAVRKDGGDDSDATDGILVYATVSGSDVPGITVDGGKGVGRITRKGLDQPVGNAAINRVPREMIRTEMEEVCVSESYTGGLISVISVPEGETVAVKTFNPNLGIAGGISIIGTSGIVEPMSETALIDTIRVQMKMALANGKKHILVVPGNYGTDFIRKHPELSSDEPIKCSNFIGETLDMACELGAESVLLVGNLGKLVKLAGGIMNTHSKHADCRMEILASNAALAGADSSIIREILGCISTDDALDILERESLTGKTMDLLTGKIEYHMNRRTGGKIRTGAVVFSNSYGIVGETSCSCRILEDLRDGVQHEN